MKQIRSTLLSIVALLLAPVAGASGADAAAAATAHWADLEGQIQYGFYTEDARALANLAEDLARSAGTDRQSGYYAALAGYRQAQIVIAARAPAATAAAAASRCVEQLEAIASLHDDAEALALDAACRSLGRSLQSLKLPLLGGSGSAELARALRLAPRSPRVVLIDALAAWDSGPTGRERALHRLEQAVQLFEAEREHETVSPGWGAAEAYAWLGRCRLERGEAALARGALERALLLAPDFALARRLMARIVG